MKLKFFYLRNKGGLQAFPVLSKTAGGRLGQAIFCRFDSQTGPNTNQVQLQTQMRCHFRHEKVHERLLNKKVQFYKNHANRDKLWRVQPRNGLKQGPGEHCFPKRSNGTTNPLTLINSLASRVISFKRRNISWTKTQSGVLKQCKKLSTTMGTLV